ncbi:MAG: hypothetical protein WCG07_00085 [Candidatus Taylorbacteria bacterium]
MRDYQLISPSLEGVLNHYSIVYEGIRRPNEVLRALDSPARRNTRIVYSEHETKVLEQYFHDIHNVFLKKFSSFIMQADVSSEDSIKLQALLQELLKIKKLITSGLK